MNEKLTEFEKILKNFEKVYESVTQSSLQSKVFIGGVIILTFLILMVNLCQYRRQRVPSKTAKLCLPPLFSIHGHFHGSEEGEIET